MIDKSVENKDCVGCYSCIQKCPKECIIMKKDKEGFYYPCIDKLSCIGCNVCEKVCPVLNKNMKSVYPLISYAFIHKDEKKRKESSTAGAFIFCAEKVLNQNGIVFGCTFDNNWQAKHISIEAIKDLYLLVGSKYVQSQIGNTYLDCELQLRLRRLVLFLGTPCQIAGLKSFLGKDYINLICIDLICHGIPSPGVWDVYLNWRKTKMEQQLCKKLEICKVNFRNKMKGWCNYALQIEYKDGGGNVYEDFILSWSADLYMISFLKNLNVRPSCFKCKFRNQRSGSDITIGDYWKFYELYPEYANDDKGVNAIIVNTPKGMSFFEKNDYRGFITSYENVIYGNPQLIKSHIPHVNRSLFFKNLYDTEFDILIDKSLNLSLRKKIIFKISQYINNLK